MGKTPNNPSFERMQKIDAELRAGHCLNREQLAEICEVNVKTIQRDINFMRDRNGAPIEYDRMKHGYRYTKNNWFLPAVQLSERDLFSMLVARQAIEQYKGTPLAAELKKIYERIVGPLSDSITITAAGVTTDITFSPPVVMEIDPDVWSTIMQGVRECKAVKIQHQGIGKLDYEEKVICPYHIVCLQGEWYVLAGTLKSEKYRQYALGRISEAKLTNIPGGAPEDFDVDDILSYTFGRFVSKDDLRVVKIQIQQKMAPWVLDRKWHPRQQVETLPNGDVEISFPVSAAGPWPFFHVVGWVLSWGRNAKVLEPVELKKLVDAEVDAMRTL